MGWVANALLLVGGYLIAKRQRGGFVWNLCGTGLWVWIAYESRMWDLAFIEVVFCVIAAWSFKEWGGYDRVPDGEQTVRATNPGVGCGPCNPHESRTGEEVHGRIGPGDAAETHDARRPGTLRPWRPNHFPIREAELDTLPDTNTH